MIWKFIQAGISVISGASQINSLAPGETTTLAPGSFNEGSKHFQFTITVTRTDGVTKTNGAN